MLPWDDLEIVELVMTLEEELELEISDDEAMTWAGTTLSNVVDRLLAQEKTRTPHSSRRRTREKRHKA